MTHPDTIGLTARRLMAIDWRGDFTRTRSRVKLMREYLRRSAWWADALACPDKWPFFDIAAGVDPAVRAETQLVAAVLAELKADVLLTPLVVRTCEWALHWSALRVAGVPRSDLDDPFEPLILMYERGGEFTIEHGFIQVDQAAIRRGEPWEHRTSTKIVDLDRAALDRVDGIAGLGTGPG